MHSAAHYFALSWPLLPVSAALAILICAIWRACRRNGFRIKRANRYKLPLP